MKSRARIHLCAILLAAMLLSACAGTAPGEPGSTYPAPRANIPTPASQYQGPAEAPVVDTASPNQSGQSAELPVVASAKQDLAERLNIPADQITLVSVEEVQWPDGCLGINRPGVMCTQAIVPGYRIILEAGGVQYEYRTNTSGSQVVLAGPLPAGQPGADTPPDSAAATMIWAQIVAGVCQSAAFSGTLVAHGACDETPESASLASDEQVGDLSEFYTRYLPFEAETPAGKVVFNGQGKVTASAPEQRMLASWAGLAVRKATQGHDDLSSGLILDWRREGGIAGVCQQVSLFADGTARAFDCRRNQAFGRARLTSTQLEQLYRWLDSLQSFSWSTPRPIPPDGFTDQINFSGGGEGGASDAEVEAMHKLAEEIFLQLSTPQDAGRLQAALAVLKDYLGALQDGRYADAGGLYTGPLDFIAAMNPDLPADDAARLFERYCSQNGGVCSLALLNVVHQAQLGQDDFRFTVELSTPAGELFSQGPCCGDDQAPPLTQFDFWVARQDGLLRVQTLPPYVP